MVLTFESLNEILSVTTQMKAIEQNFTGGTVYNAAQVGMVLAFESVNEMLKCDHSNESQRARVLS